MNWNKAYNVRNMQKITAKKIITFNRLPKSRKQTFANNLKKPVVKSDSGGDYWISCISTITNSCKSNDNGLINIKINELIRLIKGTSLKRTKDMYQRNIDILSNFKEYDFNKLKPKKISDFSTKPNTKSIITLKGFDIQVYPNHVFTYKDDKTNEVGAIWFIAQLEGFKNDELQIYCELLFKYLTANYSKKYTINFKFCTVVDVVNRREFAYSKLVGGKHESKLNSSLDELRSYLK